MGQYLLSKGRYTWSTAGGAQVGCPFTAASAKQQHCQWYRRLCGLDAHSGLPLDLTHVSLLPSEMHIILILLLKRVKRQWYQSLRNLPEVPQLGGDEVRCEPSPSGLLPGHCSHVLWPSLHPSSPAATQPCLMPFSFSSLEALHNGPCSSADVYNFDHVWHLWEGDTWRVWRWQAGMKQFVLS